MGKISNSLLMLEYLSSGNKYSIKELSEKIGVSERMIKYYKNELEVAGIYIESFMGPNGGYFMTRRISSYRNFTKYDIRLLENVSSFLIDKKFDFANEYNKMLNKIKKISIIEQEKSKFNETFENENKPSINYLKKCINDRIGIEILYEDIGGDIIERKIHPLQLFSYDSRIYITSFCELRNDIRHFELDRVNFKNK